MKSSVHPAVRNIGFSRKRLATEPFRLKPSLRTAYLLILFASPAFAHPAPYSYLDLHLRAHGIEATLTAHTLDLAHELNVTPADALLDPAFVAQKQADLLKLLQPRLTLFADGRALPFELARVEPLSDRQALALHLQFAAHALPGLLKIRCALFPYDVQHQTFVNLYETDALARQEVFSHTRTALDHFTGTRQGAWAAVTTFLVSGVYHIFTGPDHVLFLLGLLLLGGSLRRLLLIVTAFTVAHSVTLTLAALHLANPPARVIEAAIALSIVYVGIDNLLVKATSRDMRAWIAFFFGLVHGFGFANVLREFHLPANALGWSLFSFNLGVELGQLCIVAIAASLLAFIRRRYPALSRRVVVIGSICVSLAGAYWFVQRVFLNA
jgi:hydrogenase/urease accessory protein HupE